MRSRCVLMASRDCVCMCVRGGPRGGGPYLGCRSCRHFFAWGCMLPSAWGCCCCWGPRCLRLAAAAAAAACQWICPHCLRLALPPLLLGAAPDCLRLPLPLLGLPPLFGGCPLLLGAAPDAWSCRCRGARRAIRLVARLLGSPLAAPRSKGSVLVRTTKGARRTLVVRPASAGGGCGGGAKGE